MNVHLVHHLAHYVRMYGPLWTHSCFSFESLNGKLLRHRHGTHHVSLQVLQFSAHIQPQSINLRINFLPTDTGTVVFNAIS